MLKAIGYRLLIEPDVVKTMSDGGIIVQLDDKLERAAMQTGTILDIGPIAFKDYAKDYCDPTEWVKVGDRILYSKYGGKWIYDPEGYDPLRPNDSQKLMIIDDADVLCLIKTEEKKGFFARLFGKKDLVEEK